MSIVTIFRTFLSNPSLQRIDQLNIYIEQHQKLMSKMQNKADLFTFEQEEGFPKLASISKKYFKYINDIFNILRNDQWREDVSLIKHNISPIMNEISLQIDTMINYQKSQVASGNNELISKTKNSLQLITIVWVIALIIGFMSAYFTCKQINTVVVEINTILKNILCGDFSLRMNQDRAGDIGRLGNTVNKFSQTLKSIIDEIRASVSELHGTSTNLTSVIHETSENILQQNTETEMVSTAA